MPAVRLSSDLRSRLPRSAIVAALALAVAVGWPRPARAQMQYSASARNVTLKLTIQEGVTKIKGVFAFTVRGLASGWAASAGFKDLAKRLDSVIVTVSGGDDLNDNSYPNRCASGEFNGIGEALDKLATASGHPELSHAPLVTIGHSHGGDYWNWYNACHPDRVAVVFVHASGGVNYNGAALRTPVFYELGTGDLIENGSKKPRAGMFVNRSKGAPMALVIGQGEGHDQVTAASLAMMIDLIEPTFKLRVPADADPAKGPVRLNDINEASGAYWLGNLYTKEVAAYGSYTGNKALTSFLPNEEVAQKWKATGPGLPMSIVLPTGTCGWCGNPKDEPPAAPRTDPGPSPTVDAGAAPVTADAGSTGGTTAPDAAAAARPGKPDAAAVSEPPPGQDPEDPPAGGNSRRQGGGCEMGGGGAGSLGLAVLGLALAGALGWQRRRRRAR
jgi:hypothetical protein